jgi:3-oxoadipate enol-lactonase
LQVPAFVPHHTVITVDLRAHGGSRFVRGFTVEQMAEDVAELLAQLRLQAHVVGLSLGGCAALTLGLRHPGCVRSLVLVNTFAKYWPPGWRGAGRALRRLYLLTFAPVTELAKFVAGGLFPKKEQQSLYEAAVASLSRNPKVTYWSAVRALGAFDARARLLAIGCPTLVVAGDRDITVPRAAVELLQRSIPGAQLLVVPDSGHATPIDQPAIFNQAVLGFIRRVEGREEKTVISER